MTMFTPPPSPLPHKLQASPRKWSDDTPNVFQTQHHDCLILLSKRRVYSSFRWTVFLVPIALMLLAAYIRFWAHFAVFDLFSTDNDHEWTKLGDWSFHEPHQAANNHLVRRSLTPTPTVPVNPTLPTPFPQPFDTTLSANFSTTGCYNFFLNMTAADAFRSCRPFSLLVSTSNAFIEVFVLSIPSLVKCQPSVLSSRLKTIST